MLTPQRNSKDKLIPEQPISRKGSQSRSKLSSVKSATNLHKCSSGQLQQAELLSAEIKKKLVKMHNLQKQKKKLVKSMQLMKQGAISALLEKEDMITKLKKECQNYEDSYKGGGLSIVQIQNYAKRVQQLQNQRDELKEQLEQQRKNYMIQLQQKQRLLDQLRAQLDYSRNRLLEIEEAEKSMNRQLEELQKENQKLVIQLSKSKLALLNYKKNDTRQQGDDSLEMMLQMNKSQLQAQQNKLEEQQQYERIEDPILLQNLEQRLRQQQQKNQKEIQQLRDYYENQIKQLRNCYEQEFLQKTIINQNKQQFLIEDAHSNTGSYDNQSIQNFQHTLNNLALYLQGQNNLKKDLNQAGISDQFSYRQFRKQIEQDYGSQMGGILLNTENYQSSEISQKYEIQGTQQSVASSKQRIYMACKPAKPFQPENKKILIVDEQQKQEQQASWAGVVTFGFGLLTGGLFYNVASKYLFRK